MTTQVDVCLQYYIPPGDISDGVLEKDSGRSSFCEWKGHATYWNVKGGGPRRKVWSYEQPTGKFGPIAGYRSFYAHPPFQCFVDDEEALQQPGDFYGGCAFQMQHAYKIQYPSTFQDLWKQGQLLFSKPAVDHSHEHKHLPAGIAILVQVIWVQPELTGAIDILPAKHMGWMLLLPHAGAASLTSRDWHMQQEALAFATWLKFQAVIRHVRALPSFWRVSCCRCISNVCCQSEQSSCWTRPPPPPPLSPRTCCSAGLTCLLEVHYFHHLGIRVRPI